MKRWSTKTGALVEQLAHEIRSGVIKPGSRLRQAEMAERFGVSTTPVREAFAMLERQGLLVGSPHRGMTVFMPSVEDLNETYEIRTPLEALATEKAVENMTDATLQKLEQLLGKMERARTENERLKLNEEFHASIYAAARRPRLFKLIADLREASAAYLHFYTMLPDARDAHADHVAILAAIKSNEPKRAAMELTRHLDRTVERVSRGLSEHTADPPSAQQGTPSRDGVPTGQRRRMS